MSGLVSTHPRVIRSKPFGGIRSFLAVRLGLANADSYPCLYLQRCFSKVLLVQSVNFYFYGVCKLVLLGSPLGHPKGVPRAELSPQVTEGLLSTAIKRFHKELRFFFSLLKRKKEAKKEKSSLPLDEKGNASHEWQSHHFSLPSFNLKWHSLYIFTNVR